MATTYRNTIQDFLSAVRSRSVSGGNQYSASINADNVTVTVTKNGTAVWSKIFWNVQGAAGFTDSGTYNQDTVTIIDGSGMESVGSAQAFLNNLI